MRYYHGRMAGMALITVFIILMYSCGPKSAGGAYTVNQPDEQEFHADNDIAMTVCSLVDAVRVGEQLDTTDYNFDGVLTDGQGTPLYTDIEGNPGQWKVRVLNPDEATITSMHIGDLMTEDLRNYILSALNLNSADLVTTYINPANEMELIRLYEMGDVSVTFTVENVKTPTDLVGQIMTVAVFRN